MTTVLDPGAVLNAGPGHTIGQFFGVGGLDTAPRHHRQRAGRWATSPAMRTAHGGMFLARACAVEWEHPTGAEHLGHLAYVELPAPKGGPRTAPDGTPLTGAWLPDGDQYTELGHAQPAMTEDADASVKPRPGKSPNWHLGLALAALAGLVIVACCVTDGGGFE